MPYRQSQGDVELWIDDVYCGRWAVAEGGGKSSDSSSYADHDGDVQLGGKPTRSELTLRKLYRENVHDIYEWLDRRVSTGRARIKRVFTNDAGAVWPRPIGMTGILGGAEPPTLDKGSSDAGELELTLHMDTELV